MKKRLSKSLSQKNEAQPKLLSTTCVFNANPSPWTISPLTLPKFKIIQEVGDIAPMIKIYDSNSNELQCIQPNIIRNWSVIKVTEGLQTVYKFRDQAEPGDMGTCNSVPVFCLRYTGHESTLALKIVNDIEPTGKYIFIGTTDVRDGSAIFLSDFLFNIHNEDSSTTNSIRVMLRKLNPGSPNYDFVIMHKSNLPTTTVPVCVDQGLPSPMCKRTV